MSFWKKQNLGELTVYQAETMSWLPGIAQGFTTRHAGVSPAPYASLNLGAHVGDALENVETNRRRVWETFGFRPDQIAMAAQTHGDGICVVNSPVETPIAGMDALLTETPGVLLTLFFADCVPVYFVDPTRKAVALAHAGWRGTAANIAGKTVAAMTQNFQSRPASLLVAIGPCIAGESYEVGRDVADAFRNLPGGKNAGMGVAVFPKNEIGGTYTLNLRQVVFSQLLVAGVRAEYIAVCDEDTVRNSRDFFSHRRDGPQTGRMAAVLGLRA